MFASLLSLPEAILLGIVEGITEFLPVSSTGHLLVVSDLIGFADGDAQQAADTYAIAIQFGAILAVLGLYRSRVSSMLRGVAGRDTDGRHVAAALAVAFVPAALAGFLFGDAIKDALFGPVPITIAWCVGGIFLIVWTPRAGTGALHNVSLRSAAIIGVAQVIALWPGVSRSLVTLVAGLLVGLSLSAAIEFSFLLGLITLSAATIYDTVRHGDQLLEMFGLLTPLVGVATACVTAVIAVRWMVSYLGCRSLAIFGWYRIAVAAVTLALMATSTI